MVSSIGRIDIESNSLFTMLIFSSFPYVSCSFQLYNKTTSSHASRKIHSIKGFNSSYASMDLTSFIIYKFFFYLEVKFKRFLALHIARRTVCHTKSNHFTIFPFLDCQQKLSSNTKGSHNNTKRMLSQQKGTKPFWLKVISQR